MTLLGDFSAAVHTGAPGHLCVDCGRIVFAPWMRDVLCAPRSDSRAAGACILSNTADQQAAVVWSTFAGIIRRLGFIFVRSHRNTGVAGGELEGIHQREKRGCIRCEKAVAFRDLLLFLFCFFFHRLRSDLISREMQPLPDRCVAPQLQPTGLYRRNQPVRVVHEKQNIQREPRD